GQTGSLKPIKPGTVQAICRAAGTMAVATVVIKGETKKADYSIQDIDDMFRFKPSDEAVKQSKKNLESSQKRWEDYQEQVRRNQQEYEQRQQQIDAFSNAMQQVADSIAEQNQKNKAEAERRRLEEGARKMHLNKDPYNQYRSWVEEGQQSNPWENEEWTGDEFGSGDYDEGLGVGINLMDNEVVQDGGDSTSWRYIGVDGYWWIATFYAETGNTVRKRTNEKAR
ncbi:MAG: hypothetical protein KAR20_25165, partial [Candidatus Heimdallarchaeota archaeon]|nr:hypothetical protein [Candidatus Heimdallarchaeota archaeon]